MNKPLQNVMPLALLVLAFPAAAAPPSTPPAHGRDFDVTVVNGASNPVPVTGAVEATIGGTVNAVVANTPDVNVANTPDVNVTNTPDVNVANTPDVNVVNTPDVHVLSSPSVPVFVNEGAAHVRELFTRRWEKHNAGVGVDYTVPPDRILVIESINVTAWIAADFGADSASLRIRPPGVVGINNEGILYIPIVLTAAGRTGTAFFPSSGETDFRTGDASLTTRLYAGPGHDLMLSIPTVTGLGNEASGVISVSGYLVPSDSPKLSP